VTPPLDNAVYDRMADSWWDEAGFLHSLAALNPARFGYMRRVLVEELRVSPQRSSHPGYRLWRWTAGRGVRAPGLRRDGSGPFSGVAGSSTEARDE
jgi:2-polyprenyl-3-methyl-5-hydroxy-6-metoxy-1,4-benzoquinol methylase